MRSPVADVGSSLEATDVGASSSASSVTNAEGDGANVGMSREVCLCSATTGLFVPLSLSFSMVAATDELDSWRSKVDDGKDLLRSLLASMIIVGLFSVYFASYKTVILRWCFSGVVS